MANGFALGAGSFLQNFVPAFMQAQQMELLKKNQEQQKGLNDMKMVLGLLDAPAKFRGPLFDLFVKNQGGDPSQGQFKTLRDIMGKVGDEDLEDTKAFITSLGLKDPGNFLSNIFNQSKNPEALIGPFSQLGKLQRERDREAEGDVAAQTSTFDVSQLEQARSEVGLGQQGMGPALERQLTLLSSAPQTEAVKAARETLTQRLTRIKEERGPSAATEIGKLIQDRPRVVQQFGEGSQQVAAYDESIQAALAGEKPKQTDEAGLRKEFTQQSKEFLTVRDAFKRIQASTMDPSAAGDLAIVFSFMKVLDPTSAVRETEFANAENAAGIPARVRNIWNRVLNGERLPPEQRADFLKRVNLLFKKQLESHRLLERQFTGIARRNRFDPTNIIVDFVGELGNLGPSGRPMLEDPDAALRKALGE